MEVWRTGDGGGALLASSASCSAAAQAARGGVAAGGEDVAAQPGAVEGEAALGASRSMRGARDGRARRTGCTGACAGGRGEGALGWRRRAVRPRPRRRRSRRARRGRGRGARRVRWGRGAGGDDGRPTHGRRAGAAARRVAAPALCGRAAGQRGRARARRRRDRVVRVGAQPHAEGRAVVAQRLRATARGCSRCGPTGR